MTAMELVNKMPLESCLKELVVTTYDGRIEDVVVNASGMIVISVEIKYEG